jgi:hypothetical protein
MNPQQSDNMRPTQFPRLRQSCLWVAGALLLAHASIRAQTFAYTNCDLVAGFRIPGASSDLVVNLGSVAAFENFPLRSVIMITNLSVAQLSNALPTLNGVMWSVSAAMRGNPNYPQYPLQTIWVSSPRPDIDTPGVVWERKGQFTQGTVAGQIDAIGAGAVIYGNSQPASADNTETGIVISSTDVNSYTVLMTANGDFDGTLPGTAENATPTNFVSTGAISRSVLYKLLPGLGAALNAPGQPIGFFDLRSDGTMTFTAGPPPERTTVTSFHATGGVNTISFPTSNSVYYRLRFSDSLITPIGNWSTNGAVLVGDGTIRSLQDTNASPAGFYSVESF